MNYEKLANKMRSEVLGKKMSLEEMDNYMLNNIEFETKDVYEYGFPEKDEAHWAYQNDNNNEYGPYGINVIWEWVKYTEKDYKNTIVKIIDIFAL